MKIDTITCIFFSPTGTTRKIVEGIASGIAGEGIVSVDLTLPDNGHGRIGAIEGQLAIIGVPVYGGRVPKLAAERLRSINGNSIPAVVVAVYGNREYEDALLELRDISMELGFKPIAAAAFIGEHSYHSDSRPIAPGRPDAQDSAKARRFGSAVFEKLVKNGWPDSEQVPVPGNSPYMEWIPPKGLSPVTDATACTLCRICETACPAAAIEVGETVQTDHNTCILCSACVKKCPAGARMWDVEWIQNVQQWLSTNFHERKEPEVFF